MMTHFGIIITSCKLLIKSIKASDVDPCCIVFDTNNKKCLCWHQHLCLHTTKGKKYEWPFKKNTTSLYLEDTIKCTWFSQITINILEKFSPVKFKTLLQVPNAYYPFVDNQIF